MKRFMFPKWTVTIRPTVGVVLAVAPVYLVLLVYFGFSPKTIDVGYQPHQPVPFSHKLHAGDLGMDCRYCHTTVEKSAHASIPPTTSCMNCHKQVWAESPNLAPVRESYATGMPIEWVRVHNLPDYAFFDHSAHVNRGIGCASCHGRIDKMEVVYQAMELSMSWCLECHRNPEHHLRPKDQITNMAYQVENQAELGLSLLREYHLKPSQDCSTCHR